MSENFDFELAKLLREQVPNDESIHSTLLRTLLAYDPNIKPIGVIGNSGMLVDAPFVQKGYEHLFYRYPDHVLLEMIDMSLSVDGKDNCLFDNPAYYTYRIQSTFFSGRRTRERASSSRRVRYCLDCIKESIDSVGYGYFRHFWYRSNVCLIHGHPLKEVPDWGFSKTLKAVKRLLNAKDCKQAIVLKENIREAGGYHRERSWNEMGKYLFPIKFAPGCLMPVFAKWVYNHYSKFEDTKLRGFAQKVTSQYQGYYDLYEFDYRRDFASIFLLCAEFEPELLHSFMINEVSLIGLELGPRKQGVLREIFAKHSVSDCGTCKEKSCIMKTHQGTFSVDATELNLKRLFENSYTLARISMQGRPIRTSKDSIWGAIDVSPDVIDKKFLEKVEFQLNEVCLK
ncbi:hypothetical protein BC354_15805 [Vibrio cholerae]|nr:hypothetical protein [Vibrio cholerae]MCR9708944.1 TniQ family protein [Vibrio cholerae]RGP84870.1 hypothetical protein BC354_15805 [Vibrio cholerae]RGP93775.1 hypothetical protein BC352_15365 [Vibrio cholerae]